MGNCNSKSQLREQEKGLAVDKIIKASKAICKIILKEKNQNATGFFMEIYPTFICLLTNYHVISQEMIDSNTIIEIVNDLGVRIELKLNKNERYIQCFKEPIDITVIQIKNTDGINKYFNTLEYDSNFKNKEDNYKGLNVFILQHRFGNKLENANGKVIDTSNNEFSHGIDTEVGSSGSPIFLSANSKVMGIHKSGDITKKKNYGTFIGVIYKNINKDLKNGLIKDINISQIMSILSSNEKYKQHKSNYIIAEIYISIQKINKDVLIINSCEEVKRNSKVENFDETLKNENEIKECEIQINEKKINFSYYYKFQKEGIYKIKYTFKNDLTKTSCMFYKCSSLINIDLSHFNTQNVTEMRIMFFQCKLLKNINLSNLNTQNVTNMGGMFSFCYSLNNLDLSDFNTESVRYMNSLFFFCTSLENINISNFNTRNTTDMSLMFSNCYYLKNIDLSNFNTQNVKYMNYMFCDCLTLKNIDLSNFNTQNLIEMEGMFIRCFSLSYLNLTNFNTQNVRNMKCMFKDCKSLKKESLIVTDEEILEEYMMNESN